MTKTATATDTARDLPPVLLVHGFWHGSWAWSEVAARLTAAGRRVLAVDMAGHGLHARRPASADARPFDPAAYATEPSPVAGVDLDAAGDLLVSQIRALGDGRPVVVVAHSFSGPVLTRAAQQVPELVARAVYLAAMMPASDVPPTTYLQSREQAGDKILPLFAADPAAVGALRLDLGAAGDYRAALREAWYADVDPQVADAAIALLTPDAPAAITVGATTLTERGWGSVPRTYVRTTQDFSTRLALQGRFVDEADAAFPDNPTTVVTLESSHSPMLSMPGALAEIIDAAR